MTGKLQPAFLFSAIVVVAFAVGCGSSGSDKNGLTGSPTSNSTNTTGGSTSATGGTVNVLGIWGGEELDSFNAMVKPYNGKVAFTGSRDITSLLTTRVEGGNPPDVALPAEIGLFQKFAKEGKLTPLSKCPGLEDAIKKNYPQAFLDLATVNGTLYGFFMKADSKATIWYNPKYFSDNNLKPLTESSTAADLFALADQIKAKGLPPFSIGMEAGSGSGFPGSDVIQQFVLNDGGVKPYDGMIDGSVPLTDPAMKDAWQNFGKMVLTAGYTSQGGAIGVNATNFQDSSYAPFQSPPQAGMVPLGGFTSGFIKTQFPSAKAGQTYDFMPWPGGAVTGGANIAYAFNANPATCAFMSYLAGADAQTIWVKRGGFTSVNKAVDASAYPDDVSKKAAQQLTGAKTFRFDLDDTLGGAIQQAEFKGITQYLANPNMLDQILAGLQAARKP